MYKIKKRTFNVSFKSKKKSLICQCDAFGKMLLASIHFVLALTPSSLCKISYVKILQLYKWNTAICSQIPFIEKYHVLVERKKDSRMDILYQLGHNIQKQSFVFYQRFDMIIKSTFVGFILISIYWGLQKTLKNK